MTGVVFLCPLEIERAAVRRAIAAVAPGGADASSAVEVRRCGPGPAAVAAALREALAKGRPRLVVLAGLAGGLRVFERAPTITRVIDRFGASWPPPVHPGGAREEATVIGVDEPVGAPAEKRALRERTGADLVDCESHAFAAACAGAGLQWAIVRGVSDGPCDTLPRQAERWVSSLGRVRPLRLARDAIGNPRLLVAAIGLAHRSRSALREVGAQAAALMLAETSGIEAG